MLVLQALIVAVSLAIAKAGLLPAWVIATFVGRDVILVRPSKLRPPFCADSPSDPPLTTSSESKRSGLSARQMQFIAACIGMHGRKCCTVAFA